jgi:putative phosphoesterase
MKIGIFSDSHDHVWNLRRAVEQAREAGVQEIIHCGDLVSPFLMEEFDEFPGRIHLIYGNNMGDPELLNMRIQERKERVTFHGWLGELKYGQTGVAFIHDPRLASKLARSGDYRLVCFGHTHLWHVEKINKCVLLNPGAILGNKEPAGWALVDTVSLDIEHVLLGQ